jgi:hypothetical protein
MARAINNYDTFEDTVRESPPADCQLKIPVTWKALVIVRFLNKYVGYNDCVNVLWLRQACVAAACVAARLPPLLCSQPFYR